MEALSQLLTYYNRFPAMALLRALEIEEFKRMRSLCIPPIMDLGCGDGLVANLAFEYPLDIGLDIDNQSLKKAFQAGTYRMALNADARYLPFKGNTFRTIYSNSAIEHMYNLDIILAEIRRVLKPGGNLIAFVPSDRILKPVGLLGRFLGQKVWDKFNRLQNHVNLLDENQWRSILSQYGLKMKLIKTYCNYPIAGYIFDADLCGKFHFNFHWPFLHLRHLGNLGLLIGRISLPHLKRIFAAYSDSNREGYNFLILAVKT